MENASKALIMAGAVLIAILIISLGIVIFKNMSNSVVNNTKLDKEEISQFNAQITPYIGQNISGSQVNALIQLVRSINQKAITDENAEKRVSIAYPGGSLSTDNAFSDARNVDTSGTFYKVTASYGSNGLINSITVE